MLGALKMKDKKKEVIKNESEMKKWFIKNYKKLGYSGIARKDVGQCPDFIMVKNGQKLGVELETVASNFLLHKHDLNKVDEIICVVRDVNLDKPVIKINELKFVGSPNIKVTLSIDIKVYNKFQTFCEKNAFALSKKVEIFMRKMSEKGGENE